MKHLYEIDEDDEVFAADDEEQARAYYKELTGRDPRYVDLLDDDTVVPDFSDNPNADHSLIGKTYAQVAEEYAEPCQVWTTYT